MTSNLQQIHDPARKELDMLKKLSRAEVLEPYRAQRFTKDGRILDIWLTATVLVKAGEVYAISTIEREVKPENKGKKVHD